MANIWRDTQRRENWALLRKAALELVTEHGFAAVTADLVADRAGLSRRTFFNHFPTKAAAIFDPHPDDAVRLHHLLDSVDPKARPWAAMAEVCVTYIAERADILTVQRRLVAEHPELRSYQRAAYAYFGAEFEQYLLPRLRGDSFRMRLIQEAASGVLQASFDLWQTETGAAGLVQLLVEGFSLVGAGLDHTP